MRSKFLLPVLAFAVAGSLSSVGVAQSKAPQKRVITLGVLPEGATKDVTLTALEGGTGSIAVPDIGLFVFDLSFRNGDDKNLVVKILDGTAKPNKELGTVDVPVDGKKLKSKTKPSFEIHVVSVK